MARRQRLPGHYLRPPRARRQRQHLAVRRGAGDRRSGRVDRRSWRHGWRIGLFLGRDVGPAGRSAPLAKLIAADRRGEAVEYFQREVVGIPAEIVAQLRHVPFRPGMERIAHTLVYEAMIVSDGALPSAEVAARVTPPTLAIAGGAGSPIMPRAAQALERLLPNARAHILPEQGHDLEPAALGPVLAGFFGEAR